MLNLEQVKLLESKVGKTLDYIERQAKENAALRQKEVDAQAKLESHQKRIRELEVLVKRFREDQSEIETSFFAALDRLNQFEKAMEKSLRDEKTKESPGISKKPQAGKAAEEQPQGASAETANVFSAGNEKTCFEIPNGADGASGTGADGSSGGADSTAPTAQGSPPENAGKGDIPDPLENAPNKSPTSDGELDIF
jgi:hypothetical protein